MNLEWSLQFKSKSNYLHTILCNDRSRMKKTNMTPPFTRRSFFWSLGKGLTSIAVIPQIFLPNKVSASPNSVKTRSHQADDWFNKIKGKHRIVYDATSIHDGFSIIWSWVFLDSHNENGKTDEELTTLVVFRQNAFALALNDQTWSSHKLGKFLKISDPLTNVPATTNPYWNPPKGMMPEAGMSIKMLMERGAMFCVCERALTVNSGMFAKSKNLNAEQVKKEWIDGLLPGVQLVTSGVWAVNRAQEHGCSYCFAG